MTDRTWCFTPGGRTLSTKLRGQGLGGQLLRDAFERIVRSSFAGPAVPKRLLLRFDEAAKTLGLTAGVSKGGVYHRFG